MTEYKHEWEMKPYIYCGPVRLHLPDYNKAAWEIEGKYIYTQFKTYEEYRERFDEVEDDETE